MRQYDVGEDCCEAVVKRSDLATLNRACESAEMIPTISELKHPAAWLRRIG